MSSIVQQIASSISAKASQVEAAIKLLDEGATVPFIARYRKEATGALDDGQLRQLQQQLGYLRDLNDRRQSIINVIKEQGNLTQTLHQQLLNADTKTGLEDLYQPFKIKRRSKALKAREAGLAPLAEQLMAITAQAPEQLAPPFINSDTEFNDVAMVLEGTQAILIEQFSEASALLGRLRQLLRGQGQLKVKVAKGKESEGAKFSDYFDYQEPIRKIPSHRLLAILRGSNAGILKLSLILDNADQPPEFISRHWQLSFRGKNGAWLQQVVQQCWKKKLQPQLAKELVGQARDQAEIDAIDVFARNLKKLLLAAPAGLKTTLGLDPGLRTGVKIAVVDNTGKLMAYDTIYPHVPRNRWQESLNTLATLCTKHQVELISIGNGTGSRETDKLVADLQQLLQQQQPQLNVQKLVVSEAGASVYSASELAAKEFPELDVSIRGAVSIARRLQDPLAELIKIDPKAIGVGQYQHDVNQNQLSDSLDTVIEDCVNAVGVDLNTASETLLSHIAGLTPTLAHNIVEYRDQQGAFDSRIQLKKVPRLGPKAFEQAAGFLRINNGKQPLDASGVHPEAYSVVKKIADQLQRSQPSLIGDTALLQSLNPADFTDQQFGDFTVRDILKELDKPGRDPRPAFKTAEFQEGVERLEDLTPGMQLEGVVTNVTNFGAFVDIGVHQDGLVHISALADRFVKSPHDIVSTGNIVKVRVVDVDLKRKRIGLSMKAETIEGTPSTSATGSAKVQDKTKPVTTKQQTHRSKQQPSTGTMAKLFSQAKKGNRL